MAKKGQAVSLQIEIRNEEEWETLLKRPGLIVTDVYSDWCGPCAAMSGNLKKIKMEIGGDNLILASAKSERINCLKRFQNKSEPTWMFISNGKMVALMFGANAPRLMKLIADELEKEKLSQKGEPVDRILFDFEELTPEEMERMERKAEIENEAKRIEEDARLKVVSERKLIQCKHFLENLKNVGLILFYPHVGNDGMSAISEQWDALNLTTFSLGRPRIVEEMLSELFFYEEPLSDDEVRALIDGDCAVCLVRPKDDE